MKIILLGAPGVGKGTQAEFLSKEYSLPILSTGKLLKDFINEKDSSSDPLHIKVRAVIESGGLVSEEVIEEIIKNRLNQKDCTNGFILDGFPRTMHQVERLNSIALSLFQNNDFIIINIHVSDEELLHRLTSRFMCVKCFKVYNKISLPTKIPGVCDVCESIEFEVRKDDEKEVVKERMKVYQHQTQPLIQYYKHFKGYIKIDGEQEINSVFKEIKAFINKYKMDKPSK